MCTKLDKFFNLQHSNTPPCNLLQDVQQPMIFDIIKVKHMHCFHIILKALWKKYTLAYF